MAKRKSSAAAANRKAATVTARGARLSRRRLTRYGLYALGITTLCAALAGLWFWHSLYRGMPDLPPTAELWESGREPAIEFVDADGDRIAIRGPRYGRAVAVEDLPEHVVHAFLAAEDKRFYEHDGADTKAIARAAWANWRSGKTVSGASTITQQLIKNLVLTPERTLRRKAQEVRLAQALEERLTKDEILELYLNRVYFGAGAYGLGAASDVYFGVQSSELTLAQSTLLATLPKAPSRLALSRDLDAARQRQAYVLSEMVDAGHITAEEAETALAEPIELTEAAEEDAQFGYLLDTAAERLKTLLPDAPSDLVVTLTIDTAMQTAVQASATGAFDADAEEAGAAQLAALVMHKDGAIVAMVGGTDYGESEFNRATQARRQPGSAFKPIVYAAALELGYTPFSVVYDEPVVFDDWAPQNYAKGVYLGPVTVSESLSKSLNTVAASLGHEIGEDRVIATARRFGVSSNLRPLPSIALGSQEATLWDMCRAFGVFMKGGERLDPYLIAKIETSRGETLYERPDYDPARVYPAELAAEMNAMLARTVDSGTGAAAALDGRAAAGKTGTSQDWRDAWFIGFTDSHVGGVWVGNDDDSPMNEVTGGGLPADVWKSVMQTVLEGEAAAPVYGVRGAVSPSEAVEQRLKYYRSLSAAFKTVESRQVAGVGPGASQQAR